MKALIPLISVESTRTKPVEVPDKILNGVIYKPWQSFNFNAKYKNLILWRSYGLFTVLPFNVKADQIIFDMHDNFVGQLIDIIKKFYKKVNKICYE